MYKVLIVDDERNTRKAYRSDIDASGDFEAVEMLNNARDAVLFCELQDVDLVLMDINTSGGDSGIEACAAIKKKKPDIRVIITTSYTDPRAIELSKKAGADGFWLKDYSPIELMDVIRQTMGGDPYWPKEIPDVVLNNSSLSKLTQAERDVLYALADSVSIRKIAETLCLEESTIKTHLKNIYAKTGLDNKAELLILLMQEKAVLPKKYD